MTKIVIYGAGGFGREVAWLVSECFPIGKDCRIVCFVDDDPKIQGKTSNKIEVLSLNKTRDRYPDAKMFLAIRNPMKREKVVAWLASDRWEFGNLIHPKTMKSEWIDFGHGCIVCAGNVLTTNIKIGAHVHIHPGCTIGHDVLLGDFCTISSGAHVSGWVHFGKRVFVGAGAVFVNGTEEKPLMIGYDAVIGAGAVVTEDVPAGVNLPARPRAVARG
jgi:sugar O-acyltransferase (sialic acid O-acetyltransferase NeuD family)